MTKIDFRTQVADKIVYTCRWVRRALLESPVPEIVLYSNDRAFLARLDEALWTFSDLDFLPHEMAGSPNAHRSPVILTDDDTLEFSRHDILVNLSNRIPAGFGRFKRMLEIVSTDEADANAARTRYAYYRENGYPLHHEATK